MSMDNVILKYLTTLKVISQIPENGKIDTTGNEINIFPETFRAWFIRTVYGDGREQSIVYLEKFYKEVIDFIEMLLESLTRVESVHKQRFLINLTERSVESMEGLRNLINTYGKDPRTKAKLECLLDDMIIPECEMVIKFLKTKNINLPESLKRPLKYDKFHITIDEILAQPDSQINTKPDNKTKK